MTKQQTRFFEPVTAHEARELLADDVAVFELHSDNSESVVEEYDHITSGVEYGVESDK